MAKKKAAGATATAAPAEKKYMKPSEIVTFGIGLFGVALLTGWMPDYTMTFFADFAFKGQGFDSAKLAAVVASVFGVAGAVGAVMELIIGILVDRTRTPLGKVKPWVGFGAIPLAIISMLVFVAPNTSSFTVATIWMFVIYSLYTAISCAVESPSNCFGALCSPNPKERSSAISIASFLRSVGQSGGQVVIIVVPAIMKALMGKQQYKNAEGQGLDLIISTAICALGMIIFVMIFFANNKERVPYTTEKVSLIESIKLVFTNKNLLMVSLTKLCGFGRGVYGTVSLYIAVYLLGSKGLKLALMLPMGIGTAVGTLLVNFVLKKFSTKKTFILFCCYGASALAILFFVSKGIGFNKTLIVPFLILNFFCGIQHGNTNVTPNIMIADCVDEMEYKTGKRQEGLAYAGYGLFSKIASAGTKYFAPFLVYTWSGYQFSKSANVAYATQSDDTLSKFLAIYTIIPAIFVVLQFVPILFYDMVGEKKDRITAALAEKRAAEAGETVDEENAESVAQEVAEAVEAQAVEANENGEQTDLKEG
ncbi:MAG: MFS transporter [Eubacterium sp.]|nr:MFS transporter [Eubacterium sp.]MBR1532125.1 MFS transporter [Eubacterium sp.]MBR2278602.1 MFS transporter [Eubacterium sp.]